MMVDQQPQSTQSGSGSFDFSEKYRLRTLEEFQQVYAAKQRAGDQSLLIFGLANGRTYSRIGLSVSRKHGNAVARNRKKRLLREAFRLTRHQLPSGFDFVLIPRVEVSGELSQYQNSLKRLTHKIANRLKPES